MGGRPTVSCVDSSHQREPTLKIQTFSQPASFPFLKPDMQTECNNAWQYQAFHIEINLVEVYQSHSIMEIDQTRPEIDIPPWTGTGTLCRTTSGTISTSRRPAMGELCRVSTGKRQSWPLYNTILVSIQYHFQRSPPWRQDTDCDLQRCSQHWVCGELEVRTFRS